MRAQEQHAVTGSRGKGKAYIFTSIVFAALAAYKTIQHLTFNTYAYDLGIRSSILYNMAFQGRVWDSLHSLHGFSGHFHPISYFLAGLYWIWPNALLLCLLQALAVSAGLLLFVLLMERLVEDTRLHLPLIALFLINPFLHNVLCYDFHPEIFAIPLTLLFFFFIEKNEDKGVGLYSSSARRRGSRGDGNQRHGVLWLALIPALCLLALKEDMGILVFSLGIFSLIKRGWGAGTLLCVTGLAWLPFALMVVIPHFQSSGQPALISLHYQGLGCDGGEIMVTLLRKPWLVLTQVFGRPQTLLTIALLTASVGAFALTRWEAALALPLLAAHLVSNNPHQMDLLWHYSAGILPLLLYSTLKGVQGLTSGIEPAGLRKRASDPASQGVRGRSSKSAPWLVWANLVLAVPAVILRFPNPFAEGIKLARIEETHRLKAMIPKDASLSVSNNLAPHFVNRGEVALYPAIEGSRYVLVDLEANIYPARWEGRYEEARMLTQDYDTIYSGDGLMLLERRKD